MRGGGRLLRSWAAVADEGWWTPAEAWPVEDDGVVDLDREPGCDPEAESFLAVAAV